MCVQFLCSVCVLVCVYIVQVIKWVCYEVGKPLPTLWIDIDFLL